jgi:hypothetical protein
MARSGQIAVTTAGTAVKGSNVPGRLFSLKGHTDNTEAVWVGNDGAEDVSAATGYPLDPGQAVTINVANLNQLWFDADVSTEKVCWLKLN